ncbi:MAG: fumarylacetoacetate hydrolase family protein [Bacillota bacterium]
MLIVRFWDGRQARYGELNGEEILALEGQPFQGLHPSEEIISLAAVTLLAPCEPSKVLCIGLNYADHARETNAPIPEEPVVFMKPPTAVTGPGAEIMHPSNSNQVDHEAELVVVIGEKTRRVSPDEAAQKILGYTCGNDVSARDWQFKTGGQWTMGKAFDTFAPIGPAIVTGIDPRERNIRLILNGQVKQSSNTREMIFDVYHLVSYLSQAITLLPGDVIFTGTPSGIGRIKPGDRVEVDIEGIGRLVNTVVAE